jgi:methionyl-tRNA formyltransferase
MNILLVGEESAGIKVMKEVLRIGGRIVAVMASPDRKSYGGASMWRVAESLGLKLWPSKWVKDPAFARHVVESDVDIMLNVHSLNIINGEVLNAPRIGCFNLHPGPLPRYAGLNAPNWAIFHGEISHGVTIHKMESGIDTGHIVYQSFFEIGANDSALMVSTKCIKEGVTMMIQLLETAERDPAQIPLHPQDLTQREYFKPGAPTIDGYFRSLSARQFVNLVRACDYHPLRGPWESPRVRYGDLSISIAKARLTGELAAAPAGEIGRINGAEALVACLDEWVAVSKLIVAGERLNAAEVLKQGDRLEDVTMDLVSKAASPSFP